MGTTHERTFGGGVVNFAGLEANVRRSSRCNYIYLKCHFIIEYGFAQLRQSPFGEIINAILKKAIEQYKTH